MRRRTQLEGWESIQGRGVDGTIESDERVTSARPVVAASSEDARRLGDQYFQQVSRLSRGAVQPRDTVQGVDLRVLRVGPRLLRFSGPELSIDPNDISCSYRILGGLLARLPVGTLTLSQRHGDVYELRAAVMGFAPRLSSRLYKRIQHRVHVAVSRRYFGALLEAAARR